MISYSQRGNKSFTSKKAWWISLAVVQTAVQRVVMRLVRAVVPSVVHAKCILLFAPSVERRRRCHSYPRMIAPCIVAHATTRYGWHATKTYQGRLSYPCIKRGSERYWLTSYPAAFWMQVERSKDRNKAKVCSRPCFFFIFMGLFLIHLRLRVLITGAWNRSELEICSNRYRLKEV